MKYLDKSDMNIRIQEITERVDELLKRNNSEWRLSDLLEDTPVGVSDEDLNSWGQDFKRVLDELESTTPADAVTANRLYMRVTNKMAVQ